MTRTGTDPHPRVAAIRKPPQDTWGRAAVRSTVLQGERNRQHNWEHLKDNGQQTSTKEVQIENTIETVIDDVKGPVKQINAVKNTSVTINL